MRRITAVLACAVAFASVAPAPALQAATDKGIGIRLLDAPTARKDDPRAQLYVVDHLAQGAAIKRRFEVSNDTQAATHLSLYAAAAALTNGGFEVAAGHTPNELTEWTTVEPAAVDLAPGETAIATLSVRVPRDASDGERYAAVLAETPPTKGAGAARISSRVGIRMYIDVGSGREPPTDFTVSTLTASRSAAGGPVVTAQVRNTGKRAIDLTGELALTEGPGGLRAGPFSVDSVRTLAAGATGAATLTLDKSLPSGPWHARLTMRSGRVEHTVTATLTFPDKAGASAAPVRPSLVRDRGVVVPFAAALLLLVLLLLLLVLWRRRRRKDEDDSD